MCVPKGLITHIPAALQMKEFYCYYTLSQTPKGDKGREACKHGKRETAREIFTLLLEEGLIQYQLKKIKI